MLELSVASEGVFVVSIVGANSPLLIGFGYVGFEFTLQLFGVSPNCGGFLIVARTRGRFSGAVYLGVIGF